MFKARHSSKAQEGAVAPRSAPWRPLLAAVVLLLLGAAPPAPREAPKGASATPPASELLALALERGFGPLPPPPPVRPALVELGRHLAFDDILSGARDISCMTCHDPAHGTSDGRRLGIGTGGRGAGPERELGHGLVIPRNSPALFNLATVDSLFLDGRLSLTESTWRTPDGIELPASLTAAFEFGALSALALFPVLARDEMRGYGGNELAMLPGDEPRAIWGALMKRLLAVPTYRLLFAAAYPQETEASLNFAHAGNAIAGFLIAELSASNTPWDRFLRGDLEALSAAEMRGAASFLELACSECHAGPALSDGEFHNVALAQFGPGRGDGPGGRDDYGRYRVSGVPADRYAFRTPGLRNVELTAPYGHAGQFRELQDFVEHYGDSGENLRSYGDELQGPLKETLMSDVEAILATRDELLDGVTLDAATVADLTAFMRALTDERFRDLSDLAP